MPRGEIAGSFRDPSGRVFEREGVIYREVNESYRPHYEHLMESGLYEELAKSGLLVRHAEEVAEGCYKLLRPDRLPFISYPYEWSIGQLKAAVALTLEIHKRALAKGMWLKDASAYNIQFLGKDPILIDTLSFEKVAEGKPWPAYAQFCRHFVAPLVLMSTRDLSLNKMLRVHIDGIPLSLASRLAPWKTKLKGWTLLHLHTQAGTEIRAIKKRTVKKVEKAISMDAHLGIAESLQSLVQGIAIPPEPSLWAEYYNETNYSDEAMAAKKAIVRQFVREVAPRPQVAWDLGANTGEFSKILSEEQIYTVAWDADPVAVQKSYETIADSRILPLVQDLTSPSPALGWGLEERSSLVQRGPVDLALALALIHHLAIGNNVPLPGIARFFSRLARWLIVEWVPKDDSQLQKMLQQKEDVFPDYTRTAFEEAFSAEFDCLGSQQIPGTLRTMYLFKRKKA